MLVQLSPWETASTTLQLASSAAKLRRRKRSSSDVDLTSATIAHNDDHTFAACFVNTRKSRAGASKQQQSQRKQVNGKITSSSGIEEDFSPVLSVTTSHRVAVLGTSREGGLSSSLKESALLQFTSRPGSSTSFFRKDIVNGSSKIHAETLPKVPAIIDARKNLVYALQKQNTLLVCWNALLASGPDDNDASPVKVRMESPVLSMSLLPIQEGVLFGSCQDGRLFLACWNSDQDAGKMPSEALIIEYYEADVPTSGTRHKGTVLVQHTTEPSTTVERDQNAGVLNDFRLTICQVFAVKELDAILAIHHEFSMTFVNSTWEVNRSLVRSWKTQLIIPSKISKWSLGDDTDNFLLVTLVDPSTLAIVYRVSCCSQNGSSETAPCFLAQIDSGTGTLIRPPSELPPTTRKAAIVSPELLAIGTLDHQVLLYDMRYVAVVLSERLRDRFDTENDWLLLADQKRNRLAILYRHDGHLQLRLTSVILVGEEEEGTLLPSGISLACKLRSSLVSAVTASAPVSPCSSRRPPAKRLQSSSIGSSTKIDHDLPPLSEVVDQSLAMLLEVRAQILMLENTRINQLFLLNAYEQAVARIMHQMKARELRKSGLLQSQNDGNSGPSVPSKGAERRNGLHGMEKKGDTTPVLKNGQIPSSQVRQNQAPPSIPQRFVDEAVSIILSILLLDKSHTGIVATRVRLARIDARLILHRLIQTGKVSARRHFEGIVSIEGEEDGEHFTKILRAIKLTNKRRKRVFSPVDLMHDMLRWCPDVSERLMVTMVHYALCRALPDDFASSILDSKLHPLHPRKCLSRQYYSLTNEIFDAQRSQSTGTNEATAALKEKLALVSSKLIRTGVVTLIERMLNYSDCNESLLQAAMADELRESREVNILASILAELLKSSGTRAAAGGLLPATCRQNNTVLVKWISALCNAWQDELLVPLRNGESSIALLEKTVSDIVKQTEAVFSLGNDLVREIDGSATTTDQREFKRRRTEEPRDAVLADSSGAAPSVPYAVERLVF